MPHLDKDEVKSLESFSVSSEIKVQPKDNRKVPTIVKIENNKEVIPRPLSPKPNFRKDIDLGVDVIANPKKLSSLNAVTDEKIEGTSYERMEENGLIKKDENLHFLDKEDYIDKLSVKSDDDTSDISINDDNSDNNDDNSFGSSKSSIKLTKEQIIQEKQSLLLKLARLERRGYIPSKKYSMHDTYNELKTVTESLEYEKNRDDAIKLQRKGLMTVISVLEYLNTSYNPFDLYLDGWTESVFENLDDYDDIFEELYEKYQTSVKVSPEIKLLGMVGGSALMFHFTKALFSKTSNDVPNFNDVMNNNPELKRKYVEAASKQYGNNRRDTQKSGGRGGGGGGGGAGGLFGNIFNMFGGDSGGGGGGIGDLLGGLMGGGSGNPGPSSNNTGKFEAPDNVADILNGFTDDQTSTLDISNDEEYSEISSSDLEQLKNIKPMNN